MKKTLLIIFAAITASALFLTSCSTEGCSTGGRSPEDATVYLYVTQGNSDLKVLDEAMKSGSPVSVAARLHTDLKTLVLVSNTSPMRSVFLAGDTTKSFASLTKTEEITDRTYNRHKVVVPVDYRVVECTVESKNFMDNVLTEDWYVYALRFVQTGM